MEAEERRQEILDAAEALFREKGYAGTSTGDILDRTGIARGTLYYHFESKAAVMEALVDRLCERLFEAARETAEALRGRPALERLLAVIEAFQASGDVGQGLLEHLHDPGNLPLHDRVQRRLVAGMTSMLAGIVREGISAGAFDTPYPEESMELVVVYMTEVIDGGLVDLSEAERSGRIRALVFNIGRLFGLGTDDLSSVRSALGGPGDGTVGEPGNGTRGSRTRAGKKRKDGR